MDTLFFFISLSACITTLFWLVFLYKALKEQRQKVEIKSIELMSAYAKLQQKEEEICSLKEELEKKSLEIINLIRSESSEKAKKESLEELVKTYKETVENAKKEMMYQFKNTANEILQEKSTSFVQSSKEEVQKLLEPLGKDVHSFQESVHKTLKENALEHGILKNLIHPLSANISELTKALKGDFKVQGDWGETVLERILQVSGFIKGVHYVLQGQNLRLKNDMGESAKPDCVFYLPENKKVIIDAKVSIKHGLEYVATDNTREKDDLLKKYLLSVKEHIKGLSSKNYQNLEDLQGALDFVIMFVPNDLALFTIFSSDERMQDFALQKKVMLLSPTLLLPFLQIVRNFWRISDISKNALQISEEAGKMYNKLCGFLEDFAKIKTSLDQAHRSYDNALHKIKQGRGNVIDKAKQVESLGAKTSKQIPSTFLKEKDILLTSVEKQET